MSNKALSVLIIVLMSVLSILFCITGSYHYSQEQANKQYRLSNGKYTPFKFPEKQTDANYYRHEIKALNDTAKQLNVNYLKRQRYSGWEKINNRLDYNQEIQNVEFQVAAITKTKVTENFNLPATIVTKPTHNLNTTLKGYSVKLVPISYTLQNKDKREGTFFLETTNAEKLTQFFDILNQKMYGNSHKYSTSDYIINNSNEIAGLDFQDSSQPYRLEKLLLLFLIVFIVVIQLSNSQKMVVYKLNGLTSFKSFTLSFGHIWLVSLCITLICNSIGQHYFNWKITQSTYLYQALIYLVVPLLNFILINIIQSLSAINQISKKNDTKLLFWGIYILKGLALGVSIFALVPLVQVGNCTMNLLQSNDHNTKQADYGVFYPAVIGNNLQEHALADSKSLDDYMYPTLNKKGSLIINDYDLGQKISEDIKFVKVNPNYLKAFPLYDVNGKRINVSNTDETITLAIPTTKKIDKTTLIHYVQVMSKNEMGWQPKVEIINTSPNLNTKFIDINTNRAINNEVIFITAMKNSSFVQRNIMNGQGLGDGLKIPINQSATKTFNSVKSRLLDGNYYDNYPQIVSLKQLPLEQLKVSLGNVIAQSLLVISGILFSTILIVYTTLIFFKTFKRSIAIKRINGYSILLAYHKIWLLMLAQYALTLMDIFCDSLFNWTSIEVILGTVGLESLLVISSIRYIEKRNLGDVINGQ